MSGEESYLSRLATDFLREFEMLERNSNDVRWCVKVGTIVNNGSSQRIPVWVSNDGALVLPLRANGDTKAVVGSRIRVLGNIGNILNACKTGDMGTITGIRENREDAPRSWFVMLDKGCDSYIFDGEFEVSA